MAKYQVEMVRNLQYIKVHKKHILTHSFFQIFDELKKVTALCKEVQEEILEDRHCKEEMTNAIEVLEQKVSVLEEENKNLKDENTQIVRFIKGLDREIENVCEYLEQKQNE